MLFPKRLCQLLLSSTIDRNMERKYIRKRPMGLSSLMCPRHLIKFATIFWLQNVMPMYCLFSFKINVALSSQLLGENKIWYVLKQFEEILSGIPQGSILGQFFFIRDNTIKVFTKLSVFKFREMIPFGIKNLDCFAGFKQTRLRNLIIVHTDHVNIQNNFNPK